MKRLLIVLMAFGTFSAFAQVNVRIEIESNLSASNSIAEVNYEKADSVSDEGDKFVIVKNNVYADVFANFTLCGINEPVSWYRYKFYVNGKLEEQGGRDNLRRNQACVMENF